MQSVVDCFTRGARRLFRARQTMDLSESGKKYNFGQLCLAASTCPTKSVKTVEHRRDCPTKSIKTVEHVSIVLQQRKCYLRLLK